MIISTIIIIIIVIMRHNNHKSINVNMCIDEITVPCDNESQ